ncbi:hypothetical protein NG20_01295 [Bacillus subtilis]|nr:hypothetical protein Q433_11795 [Bacillus subtilis subsp. subtilis str. OH 131.1]AOL27140.1 hypothetical protein BGM23_11325 [Bacillus sp. FJAT-14266]AOL29934.1 hypothetical protein BGM20_04525 [Alkalicoccobacillus gibsonii]AXP48680.1 hypothetical protein DYS67_10730 [Bacillus subtilis subsp. subtilis]KKJ81957.1 hypothetical protein NG20_01295 [Bacillus subtilis]
MKPSFGILLFYHYHYYCKIYTGDYREENEPFFIGFLTHKQLFPKEVGEMDFARFAFAERKKYVEYLVHCLFSFVVP